MFGEENPNVALTMFSSQSIHPLEVDRCAPTSIGRVGSDATSRKINCLPENYQKDKEVQEPLKEGKEIKVFMLSLRGRHADGRKHGVSWCSWTCGV